MKKYLLLLLLSLIGRIGFTQSAEAEQLLLNWEKLAQLKAILQNMYDGYQTLHKGYTTIKDLSQGNFTLHKTFHDGLLEVSPVVKKYKRVGDIINYQVRIVKEYKAAYAAFKNGNQFTHEEIRYISKVYASLFKQSLKSLEELSMVITSGNLRMSDDERLQAIDRIYHRVIDQYSFLQDFSNGTMVLLLQRQNERMDIDIMKRVHGVK